MHHADNEKQEKKYQNSWRKSKILALGNIGSKHYQTNRNGSKSKKCTSQEHENLSKSISVTENSPKNNNLDSFS